MSAPRPFAVAGRLQEAKQPRGQRDMSLPYQEWRLEVGAPDHGGRLDLFLARALRWRSREGLKLAIAEGAVEVRRHKDHEAAIGRLKPGLRLRRGQEVVVRLPTPSAEPAGRAWRAEEIQVVWEDEELLAVGKPPHLSVYPSRRHREASLIELVHELHGGGGYPPTLCHRLDRETSGVVLFARSREARAHLNEQFTRRSAEKTYLAVVTGEVEAEHGAVELAIGDDPGSR
ncbi:MAG: pseudouridine synthase, partial [Thermoanaerobaculia bacterium]|nr:pseudouridine synthase [Thermoanaerobaculia bacterium]